MSEQNWTEVLGKVKVNTEVLKSITEKNLFIFIPPDEEYPHVGYYPKVCPSCGFSSCAHQRPVKKVCALHEYVWDFYNGDSNPLRKGEVIHHQGHAGNDFDKSDARIKNLGKGPRDAHARTHNAKKQKFSPKKGENLYGFFRPPQPAPVIERPSLIGKTLPATPPSPKPRSMKQQVRDLEKKLADLYKPLHERLRSQDSKKTIPREMAPRSEWREPSTRLKGLRMPRLGCTEAEAAFVLMMIDEGFETEAVAYLLKVQLSLVNQIKNRVSVSVAIDRWLKFERLPTVAEEG